MGIEVETIGRAMEYLGISRVLYRGPQEVCVQLQCDHLSYSLRGDKIMIYGWNKPHHNSDDFGKKYISEDDLEESVRDDMREALWEHLFNRCLGKELALRRQEEVQAARDRVKKRLGVVG